MAYTAITGTGGGGAYQVGDKWGYQTAEQVRLNFDDHEDRIEALEDGSLTPDSLITAATDTGPVNFDGLPVKMIARHGTDSSWGFAVENAGLGMDYAIAANVENTTGVGQIYGGHIGNVGVLFYPASFTGPELANAVAIFGDLVTYLGAPASLGRANNPWTALFAAYAGLTPVAFASLPTGAQGKIAAVTDSTTVVWGATITGGGANHVLAYHNGTNWTVIGK